MAEMGASAFGGNGLFRREAPMEAMEERVGM